MEQSKDSRFMIVLFFLFGMSLFFVIYAEGADCLVDNKKLENEAKVTEAPEYYAVDGTGVPIFYQWDKKWREKEYANGTMADSGCGPTCLSMVVVYLKENGKKTPDRMADFSINNGYIMDGKTAWSMMDQGAEKLGINAKQIPTDKEKIYKELDKGRVLICSMGPGDFTSSGHFIVIAGYNEDGFIIHDPNSEKNTEKIWTYEEFYTQIKNIWSYWK